MRHPAVLLLALAALAAQAATDADLARCRAIGDATARLGCYDALPTAGSGSATAASASGGQATAAQFGFEQRALQAAPERIDSHVPGLFEGWGPKSLITLANGQVWQVVDDSRAYIDRRDPVVHVVRGALGSFVFEVEGRNQTARVQRVR